MSHPRHAPNVVLVCNGIETAPVGRVNAAADMNSLGVKAHDGVPLLIVNVVIILTVTPRGC